MTTLDERINAFEYIFEALQDTNSRLEKGAIVQLFEKSYPELKEDWTYILETLANKHPIGWTFASLHSFGSRHKPDCTTVKQLIQMCERVRDKSYISTSEIEYLIGPYGQFLAPIVNRTLRLGIGNSLLTKSDITPMLAKKYTGMSSYDAFAVTEKLDGNRCVATFNRDKDIWEFYSRTGKSLNVNFDMSGFDPDLIYDGEAMSTAQTEQSIKRHIAIENDMDFVSNMQDAQLEFNKTSGLINRNGTNKSGLVYNIFDVILKDAYVTRHKILHELTPTGNDTRILPLLYLGYDKQHINSLLGRITQMGGEGLMLNEIKRSYEHKRTDALLKYKQVQFMDMLVIGTYEGTGKYIGLVGGLNCQLITEDDGKHIECNVGSGLSDQQRVDWSENPKLIIGKIVQVGYHELTQEETSRGTKFYSLRFPRLIKIRDDKSETSEY